MTITAVLLEFGVAVDQGTRDDQPLEYILRARDGRRSACENYPDRKYSQEVPAQWQPSVSEKMCREDVDDCSDHEKEKQWQVEDMPKPEKTVVECKHSSFLHGRDVQRDEVGHAGKLPSPHFARPPEPLAFDLDDPPCIGNQPPTNKPRTPADHRQQEQSCENAPRRRRADLRKRIKLFDDAVGNGQAGGNQIPQCISVGEHLPHDRFPSVKPNVDLRVEIPPDDSAHRNNKHCSKRHIAVDRPEPKICMHQNQYRPDYAEDHVDTEPECHGAKRSQKFRPLSQRIEQQDNHQAASRDAEPVSGTTFRGEAAVLPTYPAGPEHGGDGHGKNQRSDVRPKARSILSKILGTPAYCDARGAIGRTTSSRRDEGSDSRS